MLKQIKQRAIASSIMLLLLPTYLFIKRYVVARPSNFADVFIPDWLRGGVLSPVIDDLAMASPLCLVMDTCQSAIWCRRHLIPTSLLSRFGK